MVELNFVNSFVDGNQVAQHFAKVCHVPQKLIWQFVKNTNHAGGSSPFADSWSEFRVVKLRVEQSGLAEGRNFSALSLLLVGRGWRWRLSGVKLEEDTSHQFRVCQ